MRTENGSKKRLPDALLATTEDKEHCCVIKTIVPTDSFILLGSSEPVKETERGIDGRLKSVVVGTPSQHEKGLVGVVVRRAMQDTVVYVSVAVDEEGRPEMELRESCPTPLSSGVSLSVSDGAYIDLSTPSGKFTTNFRKSHESGEHLWYVSPRKMFCFLARPSLDFLKEAAKSLYFERLALRRDELLHTLMEEIHENADRIVDLEEDFARFEDEVTELCCEWDAEEDVHEEEKEAWTDERAKFLEVLENLGFQLEEAKYSEREYARLIHALRKIFSEKRKRILFDQLYEALGDFPELFEEIDKEPD